MKKNIFLHSEENLLSYQASYTDAQNNFLVWTKQIILW